MTREIAASQPLAKLGDFGLTVMVESEMKMTDGHGELGNINPRWAAPEILNHRPFSVESDVYALGLLMWETRNRKLAYSDQEGDASMFAQEDLLRVLIVKGERPSLCFEDKFDQLIEDCWRGDPFSRPRASDVLKRIKVIGTEMGEGELVKNMIEIKEEVFLLFLVDFFSLHFFLHPFSQGKADSSNERS